MTDIKQLRVGGITFHRAINYGAVLQAYALQEAFKKLNCKYEIIDYRCPILETRHKEMKITDCRKLVDIYRYSMYSKNYNIKYRKFRRFLDTHLNISDVVYHSIEDLKNELWSDYDFFVCGSDQVWSCNITKLDTAYFLSFVEDNTKRNSYAASFGISSVPEVFKHEYCSLLKNFNNISVREAHGRSIIKELTGRNACLVLDPTLLLTQDEWAGIAEDYDKCKDYILYYAFSGSRYLDDTIQRLSKYSGCDVVFISAAWRKKVRGIYEKNVGPLEFLGLFKNARYVVTNSFHGLCFAINFNKDFFMEMLPETHQVNSRLEHILDLFHLRGRQIINPDNLNFNETIDYNRVNQMLNVEREKSWKYLRHMVEEYE